MFVGVFLFASAEFEMAKVGKSAAVTPTIFQVSVLRSKQTRKVLFLEAGKDFVDTLLSFLLLPVGTILRMLSIGT